MSGEGSIFRRASDGKWIAQLSIGKRGSRRYRSKTLGVRKPTRAEEKAALDELRAGPGVAAGSTETTGAYLERWVNEARNLKPNTRHGYRAAIVTHLVPAVGRIPLGELAPRDVERMLGRFDATLRPKTARNAHGVLRRALGQAVKMGLIPRNVAGREFVDAPRVPTADPAAFTDAEISALLRVAAPDRIGPLLIVAVETGMRQGELLGLAWENIGHEAVAVEVELTRIDGKYRRVEPKTPRSRRTIPLTEAARAAFDAQERRLRAAGFVTVSTGPVFVNHRGAALSGSWVTHRLYELEAEAGIRRLPFKNLRTTFASRLHDRGVSESTIADLMGHSRTATTRKHYIATTEDQGRAAIARLNQSPNQSRDRGEGAASVVR